MSEEEEENSHHQCEMRFSFLFRRVIAHINEQKKVNVYLCSNKNAKHFHFAFEETSANGS